MQRARKLEDKAARARGMLDAALELYRERGFAGFTMADVAGRVGLAKGTLFLYFPTKEALGVALVQQLLDAWFDDVDHRLGRLRAPTSPTRLAKHFSESMAGREDLVGLLARLGSLLEHNVDEETARAFKTWLLGRLALTGALVEKVLGFLPPGGGMRLLVHLHALVVGLHQHASQSPVVARVLEAPELEPLRIDFGREVAFAVRALMEGLRVTSGTQDKE